VRFVILPVLQWLLVYERESEHCAASKRRDSYSMLLSTTAAAAASIGLLAVIAYTQYEQAPHALSYLINDDLSMTMRNLH